MQNIVAEFFPIVPPKTTVAKRKLSDALGRKKYGCDWSWFRL